MPPTANEQLIEAYFHIVEQDDYAGVGAILTDDATWTIMPIGHTWTGRRAVESMAMAAGRSRRHDEPIEGGGMLGLAELEQRLQIKPRQSVAVVNAPPESGLRLLTTGGPDPDQADVVIGFAVRPVDLAWLRSVYAAARAGRLAWVSYPRPGSPGTDLRRDWLVRALRQYGVEAVQNVSINGTWSALRLRRADYDHQSDTSTANKDST